MSSWSIQPVFNNLWLALLMAGALAALLLIGPSFGRLTPRRRMILTALRLLAVLLVLIGLLRPKLVSTDSRPQPAALLVIYDGSRSMEVPDAGGGGKTRWEAQRDALQAAAAELAKLTGEANIEVKVYSFDRQLREVNLENGKIEFASAAVGDETDIGAALDEAVRRELGKRIAGVILLSDGAQRAYAPRVELQQAVREIAQQNSPLYTIALGLSRDQSQARDVAVEALPDNYTVFVKNELAIVGQVRVQGYTNQPVPVELVVVDPQGRETIARRTQTLAREDGDLLDVELPFIAEEPGQYRVTVRVPPQAGELVTENNELTAFVTALDGGLKVLYLYGNVAWQEQKFLRWSLDASPDVQLDSLWVDFRNRERWPLDLGAQLENNSYDVYVLADVPAAALGQDQLARLAQLVDRGKGLLMTGGYQSFGPGNYAATPLASVVPLRMNANERQDLDGPKRTDRHHDRPLQMLPAERHFITFLAAADDNVSAWRRLPALQGANKFERESLSDRAVVLAESSEGFPLLVVDEYGSGRVAAFAVDSTWRWWRYGQQAEHKRFWRQLILWLARKEEDTQDNVWLRLAQRRYQPAARVQFTTGARETTGEPIVAGANFTARVLGPDKQWRPARLSLEGDQFIGSFEETRPAGDYVIEVAAERNGQSLGTARATFMVFDLDLELADPSANPQQLQWMADATREAGGKTLAPEQLPALLAEIRQKPPEVEIEVESHWQLGDTPLDAWSFFLALVGLLSAEWFLRKKWGLV